MLKKIITLSILVIGNLVIAQSKLYLNYDWERSPVNTAVEEKYKKFDYFTLKNKHILEYAYDSNNELSLFETVHVKTHINTDKGVEAKNKMYISTARIIEMIDLRARCITAAGKVINLDKSNIKEIDNLENQGPFTIFAFEGVEPNSDIEVIYTSKKYVKIYGGYNLQYSFPQLNVEVDFITPKNLIFELKSYNGFPDFIKDTNDVKTNHLTAKAMLIEEFESEKYSADDANEQRFDYHLRYNTEKSKAKFYTWNTVGDELLKSYRCTEKDDIKAISKILDKSGALKKSTDYDKIAEFETYFKKNITFSDDAPNDLTVEKAISKKIINAYLLNKVFYEASKQLGLTCELVFTSNRFKIAFDGSFEGYEHLEDVILYYPSLGKYLAASNYYSRIGFPPAVFTNTKGLFVKETDVAGVVAAISKVKTINPTDNTLSNSTIKAKVSFTGDELLPVAKMEYIYTGYAGYNIHPIYYLYTAEQKKEATENILKSTGEQTVVKSEKVENIEPEFIFKKPLIISGDVELPQLMEKAGNKFLFKIGSIIGPQAELYQEKTRKTDIDVEYSHGFTRTIEVEIPTGYKITNLKDLNFNVVLNEDGKETSFFKSSYKQEGNKIIIFIDEEYITLHYSKTKYEEFKNVINAAADFNKVTLVLEK